MFRTGGRHGNAKIVRGFMEDWASFEWIVFGYGIENGGKCLLRFCKITQTKALHLNYIQNLPIGFASLHENGCSLPTFDRFPCLKESTHPKFK